MQFYHFNLCKCNGACVVIGFGWITFKTVNAGFKSNFEKVQLKNDGTRLNAWRIELTIY
jgi:hypothetical protein